MSEVNLYDRCLAFVQDQSSGEWGDFIEREDAKKLVEFVQSETRALSAEVEALRAGIREILVEAFNTIPPDGKEAAFATINVIGKKASTLLNKEPAR